MRELFQMAIAAERAAETLYRGFQAQFAHHPAAADFWAAYADEEVKHAQCLERIRDTQSPEQLAAPAHPRVLQQSRQALAFSVDDALAEIETLEDAYQLANELESAETNAIFDFLITNFSTDKKAQAFMRTQLKDHVTQLTTGFPEPLRLSTLRSAVKAKK
jgi:hypothetical protein